MKKFQVLGLSGFAGSGKDYIYKHYLRPRNWFQVSLAWHFKADLIGKSAITFDEAFVTKPPNVRTMLQMVGTELGRNIFGQTVWCDTLRAWMEIYQYHWDINKFVIPDVRFWNELCFIQNELGGKVIRIKAPHRSGCSMLDATQRAHSSEAEMLEMKDDNFNAIVYNDEGDPDMDVQLKEIFRGFSYDY